MGLGKVRELGAGIVASTDKRNGVGSGREGRVTEVMAWDSDESWTGETEESWTGEVEGYGEEKGKKFEERGNRWWLDQLGCSPVSAVTKSAVTTSAVTNSASWEGTGTGYTGATPELVAGVRRDEANITGWLVSCALEQAELGARRLRGSGSGLDVDLGRSQFFDSLRVFMELFISEAGLAYSELWISADEQLRGRRNDRQAVLEMGFSVASAPDKRLQRFCEYSAQLFIIDDECMPGRVWRRGNMEWLQCTTDSRLSCRADMAFRCGISSAFAIPMCLEDNVVAVMCFYDNRPRDYDAKTISMATRCTKVLSGVWSNKLVMSGLRGERRTGACE